MRRECQRGMSAPQLPSIHDPRDQGIVLQTAYDTADLIEASPKFLIACSDPDRTADSIASAWTKLIQDFTGFRDVCVIDCFNGVGHTVRYTEHAFPGLKFYLKILAFDGAIALFNGEDCKGFADVEVARLLGRLLCCFGEVDGYDAYETECEKVLRRVKELVSIGIETGRIDMALHMVDVIMDQMMPLEFIFDRVLDKYPLAKRDKVVDMIQFVISIRKSPFHPYLWQPHEPADFRRDSDRIGVFGTTRPCAKPELINTMVKLVDNLKLGTWDELAEALCNHTGRRPFTQQEVEGGFDARERYGVRPTIFPRDMDDVFDPSCTDWLRGMQLKRNTQAAWVRLRRLAPLIGRIVGFVVSVQDSAMRRRYESTGFAQSAIDAAEGGDERLAKMAKRALKCEILERAVRRRVGATAFGEILAEVDAVVGELVA